LTKRIGMFVTAHVPVMMPAFAAKSVVIIDPVTHELRRRNQGADHGPMLPTAVGPYEQVVLTPKLAAWPHR
jgi:hypothetical protein